MMDAAEFWENVFSEGQAGSYSRIEMPELDDHALQSALRHFGDVENKTIIDLGCGRGATSLFFAYHGANVISVDFSEAAIRNLTQYCVDQGIPNIRAVTMPAQDIAQLGTVDFIFGAMILHHIEPFDEFAKDVRSVVKPGGKGFFRENNARSKTMMWFRQNLVGKFWIPKHGDEDEYPLMPSEVDEMRRYFSVDVEYPELMLFQMASTYLLKGKFSLPLKAFDQYMYKYPKIRQYSYRQYLYLS